MDTGEKPVVVRFEPRRQMHMFFYHLACCSHRLLSDSRHKPTRIENALRVEFLLERFHQPLTRADFAPGIHLLPDDERRFLDEERAAEFFCCRAPLPDANGRASRFAPGGANNAAAEVSHRFRLYT